MEGALAIPASRQKSCSSCVQSKRRCDRKTPVCTRCAEKKSTCVYGKEPRRSSPSAQEFDIAIDVERLESANSARSPFLTDSSLHVDYLGRMHISADADTVMEPASNTLLDTVNDFHSDIDCFLDLMGESGAASSSQWIVQADQGMMNERPNTPADEEIRRTYKKMGSLCVS